MDDFEGLDATAQADLVRTGEVSPRELVEAAIARSETWNPAINAIVDADHEQALAWADRVGRDAPFAGVPFLLKDLGAEQAGQSQTMGNAALRATDHRSTADDELGRRFRAAGLVTLGRTNTPEFGMQPTTQPLATGPTRNPWNLDRSTSGSSGGSAAAVAAGIVPVAHGNDAAGSIRLPAAWCGVVGLKPSRGRTPQMPLLTNDRLPVEFALTRSVRDAAAVLDAVHGNRPGDLFVAPPPTRPFRMEVGADPGSKRVALCTAVPGLDIDAACLDAVREVGRRLEGLGHRVDGDAKPAHLHHHARPDIALTVGALYAAAGVRAVEEAIGRPIEEDDVEPFTWWWHQADIDLRPAAVLTMQQELEAWAHQVCTWWDASGTDLLVLPTVCRPAQPLAELAIDPANPLATAAASIHLLALTRPFNTSGEPALSLPLAATEDHLPVGVQLVAPFGREDVLIRVAAQLEQAMPWSHRRPPVPGRGR